MTHSSPLFTARIRRNLGFKLLGTAIEKLFRLLLVLVAARLLGTAAWGQYTYALALSWLFVQLTDMGLGLFCEREIARGDLDMPRGDFVGQILTLKGVLSLAYLGVLAMVAWIHRDEPVVAAAIGICGLTTLSTSTIEAVTHVFRGIQDLALEARTTSVHAAAQLVIGGSALAAAVALLDRNWRAGPGEPGEADALLLFCGAMAGAALIGVLYSARLLWPIARPRWRFSSAMVDRFKHEVLPLGVAIVASLIYYKIDVPMIRYLRGDVDTGLYTAAYKVLEYSALLPAVLMAAAFPALSEAVVDDPGQARALHKTGLLWLCATGGAATTVMWLLPDRIIWLLFGVEFAESAPILAALAPCILLTYINYLLTHMLVALGLVRQQMLICLGLIVINVALNWLWIPRWGGVGAAYATAITELALLACCAPLVWRGLADDDDSAIVGEGGDDG